MIVVIAGIRKAQRFTCNINLDDLKYTVAEEGIQESLKTIFEIPPDGMRDVPLDCTGQSVQWGWDFGFEFNGKAGFILGIYTLGLVFGYDCTNLFIKHD